MARRLVDWLHSYMDYTAHTEAPDVFHFWSGVSTIAGALQRKVWIDQLTFTWSPNFYIVLTGPSGFVNKSTTLDIGMDLLREIDGVHFGPNVLTWQALVSRLSSSQQMITVGKELKYFSCLTFGSRELGSLLNPKDKEMVTLLIDLWDGKMGVWEKMTKGQGMETVYSPWINIIAGTTPSWIADNIPRSWVGGGFTSRCLFIYAERKRRLVAYPRLEVRESSWYKLQEDLVEDLASIAALNGEFELSDNAIEYGTKWYKKIHTEAGNKNLELAQFDGYQARKQGHVHKLAMVLSAARSDNLTIQEEDLRKAVLLVESLEQDMPKVFHHIGTSEDLEKVSLLVRVVAVHKKVPRSSLFRAMFNKYGMSKREFTERVDDAIHARMLDEKIINSEVILFPGPSAHELISLQETQVESSDKGEYNA